MRPEKVLGTECALRCAGDGILAFLAAQAIALPGRRLMLPSRARDCSCGRLGAVVTWRAVSTKQGRAGEGEALEQLLSHAALIGERIWRGSPRRLATLRALMLGRASTNTADRASVWKVLILSTSANFIRSAQLLANQQPASGWCWERVPDFCTRRSRIEPNRAALWRTVARDESLIEKINPSTVHLYQVHTHSFDECPCVPGVRPLSVPEFDSVSAITWRAPPLETALLLVKLECTTVTTLESPATSMAPPTDAELSRTMQSYRAKLATCTSSAPAVQPLSDVRKSVARPPPTTESARRPFSSSEVLDAISTLQWSRVNSPASTISRPRSRKLVMCMGGALRERLTRAGHAVSVGRACGAPSIHTCEHVPLP